MESSKLKLVKPAEPKLESVGTVHLVGAGPGDPDLITVKAMKLLQRADAIVYDRLANPALLEYAQKGCDLIYVGKKKDQHSMPQEQICELLAVLAKCGKDVVRLKGGDPFVFGRGGEELDHLAKQGICCTVVPGITAATGCAASSQIPLTHRDHAHAVTFITGHRQNDELKINWDLALQPDHTVVFYMGLSRVAEITRELISRGCPTTKPFAIVANGGTDKQQILAGTVADIAAKLQANPLPSPALLIMGDVVNASSYVRRLQLDVGGEQSIESITVQSA